MVGQSDRLPMITPTSGAFRAGLRRLAVAVVLPAAMTFPLKYRAANPECREGGLFETRCVDGRIIGG
tara:strand:- start:49063 stop:49263 length:201 start_codon:yes stop_codon:yes gene_type:complete